MSNGIAYQNKDVLFKMLGETYKGKSWSVYGLNLPPVKALLPANLPAVQADERRSDHIYLLADDKTIAMVEYESQPKADALIKYGSRGFRVLETYDKQGENYDLVIIVIYTGDTQSAPAVLDRGGIRVQVRQVFLSQFDGVAIYDELRRKITANEPLTDEDVMRFVIIRLLLARAADGDSRQARSA